MHIIDGTLFVSVHHSDFVTLRNQVGIALGLFKSLESALECHRRRMALTDDVLVEMYYFLEY